MIKVEKWSYFISNKKEPEYLKFTHHFQVSKENAKKETNNPIQLCPNFQMKVSYLLNPSN